MYRVEVHKLIHRITLAFGFLGLWYSNESTSHEWGRKILQLVIVSYYPLSFALKAYTTTDTDETRFFSVASIIGLNVTVRLYYILWKKDEILELNSQIGCCSIKNREEFNRVTKKIDIFVKFAFYYLVMTVGSNVALIILKLPILTNEKQLPVNLYFPFNWKSSSFNYWVSYAIVSYVMLLGTASTFLNVLIWFLMMFSALKYQILGGELKKLGTDSSAGKAFQKELTELIAGHMNLHETTNKLKLFFGKLFIVLITTSSLGICGSIYALSFNSYEDPVNYVVYVVVLIYNIFDIFMVTHFGNEIKLSSSRLSYCLFESNWVDQSQLSKKFIIILTEMLRKPQELVIAKIYPLNFDTFTSVTNFAYSMFNILKKFK